MMWKNFREFSFQQFKILSIKSLQHTSLSHNWKFRRTILVCFLGSLIPEFTINLATLTVLKGKTNSLL